LLRIFGVVAEANRPHAAHETEQQCAAEPQAKLEIVGRVSKADNHHRRG
jgi:hypothetical protein